MVEQRRKLLAILLVIATLALAIGATAFMLADLSGEAEPSLVETQLASALLRLKLRWNGALQSSPLTPAEDDLVRGSELYQVQCAVCHGATRLFLAFCRGSCLEAPSGATPPTILPRPANPKENGSATPLGPAFTQFLNFCLMRTRLADLYPW